jgi:hypothetical protein
VEKDLERIAKLLEERFPKSRIEIQPCGSFGSEPMIVLNFMTTTDAIAAIECTHAKDADLTDDGKSVTMCVIEGANSDRTRAVCDKKFEQKFKYQSPEHLVSKFVEAANLLLKDMQELGTSLTAWGANNPMSGITTAFKKEIERNKSQ